jgi:hypothetical protein
MAAWHPEFVDPRVNTLLFIPHKIMNVTVYLIFVISLEMCVFQTVNVGMVCVFQTVNVGMVKKKGKFLWGTGLTPKHLGLVYGPLCPPNYRQFPPSSPEAPRTERCESLY